MYEKQEKSYPEGLPVPSDPGCTGRRSVSVLEICAFQGEGRSQEVYQAEENRTILYLNYEKQEAQGIYENGQTYLPADWVAEHVNSRFYWDENEEMLVYALPEEILYTDDTAVGSSGEPLIVKRGGRRLSVHGSCAQLYKGEDTGLRQHRYQEGIYRE